MGNIKVIVVPFPGLLSIFNVPPTVLALSLMLTNPELPVRPWRTRFGSNPFPSSVIVTLSGPSCRCCTLIMTVLASACLWIFCSASCITRKNYKLLVG